MTPPTKTCTGRNISRPNRYLDKGDERGRGDGGDGWTKVQSKKKPPKAKAKPSKAKAKGKPKTPKVVKKGAGTRPATRARKGDGSPSNHTPDDDQIPVDQKLIFKLTRSPLTRCSNL